MEHCDQNADDFFTTSQPEMKLGSLTNYRQCTNLEEQFNSKSLTKPKITSDNSKNQVQKVQLAGRGKASFWCKRKGIFFPALCSKNKCGVLCDIDKAHTSNPKWLPQFTHKTLSHTLRNWHHCYRINLIPSS